MLRHQLIHPEINYILAQAGHHSKVLIADGNYPAASKKGPNAQVVSLNLMPGVVTHHTTVVEHPQLVADRIVRLAKIVGRDNVIGGTDCGFAQGAFIQRVHPSIQWAKLEALVEGAKLATRELWGARATA